MAYGSVLEDVENTTAEPVPLHLRNAPTGLMKSLGYGEGYKYAHDEQGKVADMQSLPHNLRNRVYYRPTTEGVEREFRKKLEEIRKKRSGSSPKPDAAD
jgi:putative ATPase